MFDTPKPEELLQRILHIATNPGDIDSRFLRWLWYYRCSRPQDGPPLDHGGTGRALPYPHHPAHAKGHRWRRPRRHYQSGGLERRRRFPLLPPGTFAAGKGQVGQLGRQPGIQRRNAGRGLVQAGRLQLRAIGNRLVAAGPFHGNRFHLRDHAEPVRRAVAGIVRGSRRRPQPAGAVQRLPWRQRCEGGGALAQPDHQEDSQGRAVALRMGPRRLQPERAEPADAGTGT